MTCIFSCLSHLRYTMATFSRVPNIRYRLFFCSSASLEAEANVPVTTPNAFPTRSLFGCRSHHPSLIACCCLCGRFLAPQIDHARNVGLYLRVGRPQKRQNRVRRFSQMKLLNRQKLRKQKKKLRCNKRQCQSVTLVVSHLQRF